MKTTEDLTREGLLEQLNSKFLMRLPDAEPLELELVSVTELPSAPGQDQFSVIFRGPLAAPLAQGIFQLEHPQFGTFGIFLVPLGRDQQGVQYEALFNRISL
jgi:Domain of unknown function (DUF6916)